MALVNYSSSDSEEYEPPHSKVVKSNKPGHIKRLPLPQAISSMNKAIHVQPVDDPSKHEGRFRRFEHERGNWSTLVFIPVELSIIDEIIAMVKSIFKDTVDLKCSQNIHMSLTKTVILRHHLIDSFVKSIQESLVAFEHFPIDFESLEVYTNEDKTRKFIGLVSGEIYYQRLHKIMLKMDKVMNEFRLDTFYENPSFHASILWSTGDQEETFKEKLPKLRNLLHEMRNNNLEEFQIRVNEIHCKLGNKNFKFHLK